MKTAAVFLDESAKRDFAKNSTTPEKVLERIMEIFTEINSLPFSYDLKRLKIQNWSHSRLRTVPSGHDNFNDVANSILEEANSFFDRKTDVGIFFSGKVSLGYGATPDPLDPMGNGNGIMLIGTKLDYVRLFSESYCFKLARVGIHEQAHLYGIDHSGDPKSIMFRYTTDNLRFDPTSLKQLKNKIGASHNSRH